MLIRRARPDDAAATGAVLLAAGRAAWSEILDTSRMRAEVDLPGTAWVAEEGGHVIGFVAVDSARGELTLLHLHPGAWGSGAAGALHDVALAHLRAAGHDEACLYTEERNHRALAFYRRRGWEPDGTVREREFEGSRLREPRFIRPL